jgi:virginiamycin A acetyltransferase
MSVDPALEGTPMTDGRVDIVSLIRSRFNIAPGRLPDTPEITEFLRKTTGINFPRGHNVSIPSLLVGVNSQLGSDFVAFGMLPISIGKFCEFGPQTMIFTSTHETRFATVSVLVQRSVGANNPIAISKPVTVGNNVWMGARVTILPGVTIADGAVVGAGSVVTQDVPAFSVVMGNPARVHRLRFAPEIVRDLLEIAWWNWPSDKIVKNKKLFDTDLTTFTGSVHELLED